VVTGGASGIGRALGEALARRGARVVLADLRVDLARAVAARIRETGGHATAAPLDVTDFAATNRLVQDTFRTEGRLDYVFNNAGIGIQGEARLYELERRDAGRLNRGNVARSSRFSFPSDQNWTAGAPGRYNVEGGAINRGPNNEWLARTHRNESPSLPRQAVHSGHAHHGVGGAGQLGRRLDAGRDRSGISAANR